MHRRSAQVPNLAVALLLLVTGCSADPSTRRPQSPPATTLSASASTQPAQRCPNPNPDDGGTCLGPLKAGEYTTQQFRPRLTYSVPAGWDNEESLPGNFLLIPPDPSWRRLGRD